MHEALNAQARCGPGQADCAGNLPNQKLVGLRAVAAWTLGQGAGLFRAGWLRRCERRHVLCVGNCGATVAIWKHQVFSFMFRVGHCKNPILCQTLHSHKKFKGW